MEHTAWIWLRLVLLAPYLTALAVMDARTRKLPNAWTLGGLAAGIAVQAGWNGLAGVRNALGGAAVCALFLLIPYLVRAAGAGDLKLFAACGSFTGLSGAVTLLLAVSLAGFVLAVALLVARRAGLPRLKHAFRSVFDWRYDRKAGAAALPPVESESGRVPFGIALAAGTLIAVALEFGGL